MASNTNPHGQSIAGSSVASLESAASQTARQLAEALRRETAKLYYRDFRIIKDLPAVRSALNAAPDVRTAFVLMTADLMAAIPAKLGPPKPGFDFDYHNLRGADIFPLAESLVCQELLGGLELSNQELEHITNQVASLKIVTLRTGVFMEQLVELLEARAGQGPLPPTLRGAVASLAQALNCIANAPEQKMVARLTRLRSPAPAIPVYPGEAWSDAVLADWSTMPQARRDAWKALLTHCQASAGATPSAKWLKQARSLVTKLRAPQFQRSVLKWFPLVDKPRTESIEDWNREWQPDPNQLIIEPHMDILRGLVWCCALHEDKAIARALTALALSAYRKIPKRGPRLVGVGNACVYALGAMPGMEGVGQLALLKVRVKFGTAQKSIEKALVATAARVGLPREDLEEMAVPAYGLTEVGRSTEVMGDLTAELTVTGAGTQLRWLKPDGKPQTSVPASVKAGFAEEVKELQGTAKDIQRMLPAQRERLDTLFLQQKTWPLALWRERYLDHPLVGVIARRLIWEFTTDGKPVAGVFHDGRMVDLDLRPVSLNDSQTTVNLWHPIGKETEEVLAWRGWLDDQQLQQPFKQAHREVYLLTDAERQTRIYSNRYAAHVLRQHQFNALCAARGWKNKLRLMVDATFPPATLPLSKWNLRAEFWIEGIGEDYGTDTNETGVFHHVSTDQVRFYRTGTPQVTGGGFSGPYSPPYGKEPADPVPLDEIPALVLSEVLRDVDLFVGVASVGNDPSWADGGQAGRYLDYWQSYSFGDLGASATTRREVLQRLVPRLKIAAQCSLSDKFLIVRGRLRTYKIHLGSGNILMEPNDQYLCIVPKQAAGAGPDKLFLPFEGDSTLSVIISKAFLLAEDTKIQDPTIVSQLKLG